MTEKDSPAFLHRSLFPCSPEELFRWHESEGAFQRLLPPWESVEIVERSGGIRNGDRIVIRTKLGPIPMDWELVHRDYEEGRLFCDQQVKGPFRSWRHRHCFVPEGPDQSWLEEKVDFVLPGGPLGKLMSKPLVASRLRRLMKYRHALTRHDILAKNSLKKEDTMRVAVTGASGLVGGSLVPFLQGQEHEVTRLARGAAPEAPVDAVVHLAGENIAQRWNAVRKQRIHDSRVQGTEALCRSLAQLEHKPKVLVCASAVGFYGDRGDEILTEDSTPGSGFLADVCQGWEAATAPAREAGIRVVNLRIGVVLAGSGGALKKMLLPFQLGGGGILGSGKQWMSWIAIDDLVGIIQHALVRDDLSGPVNAVAAEAVTNRDYTRTLGKVLRRPTVLPMPGFAVKLAFGEMGPQLLLSSARVQPARLQQSGYTFCLPDLEQALRHVLGKAG